MKRWGRKYDHGLVECRWKAKLLAPSRKQTPDFARLKDPDIALQFDNVVLQTLDNNPAENPNCTSDRLKRLNNATKLAIQTLPLKKTFINSLASC